MKQLLMAFALAVMCGSAIGADQAVKPVRVFSLRFQLADFTVPAGEVWRLRWRSPYRPGDIRPGYDVRVTAGYACVGANREVQAQPALTESKTTTPLDLSATRGEAIVWLESGTRFATANDLLKIEVATFSNNGRP